MRTHTQDFKTKIKEYGRQFNDTIYYNNNTYDGERINSVNYTVDTSLMRSVMQTLKIDTDIPLAKGDTLDYGISLEGVTGSEIRFNNFIVDKVEDQKDKNSKLVTCYDNMIKTMVDYAPPGVTYPVTVRNYINAICTHLGITFKNASSTFTNYNKQITSEHYVDTDGNSLGYTFRDVLDDLAEATGSFICIDNTGKLEIRSVTNTNDTIDEEYFKDKNVTVGAKYGPINVVILSRGDDSDNLYRPSTLPVTKNEIKITDNPILDQDNREDFIDGIYNQLNGLEYYTNDFATNGILYYEVGDKFNVSIDNTTYSCLMLADNIKRTTGLSEKIYTKEPSTSVSDYKYASDTDKLEKTSRNAWIKANKAEGTAEMIVEGIGSQGQVTGASVIAAINGDQSNLSLNADKINLNGAVTANNNFKIKNDGSVEINNGNIDLIDNGQSTTQQECKITITDVDDDYSNSIYSWGSQVTNQTTTEYGETFDDYSNMYSSGYASGREVTHTNNEKDTYITDLQANAFKSGMEVRSFHTDAQGNQAQTRLCNYGMGADHDQTAIYLSYGLGSNNTNFSVTNGPNNGDMYLKGSATIGGTLYYGSGGREDYGAGGFTYDSNGNMIHKRDTITDRWSMRDSNNNRKFSITPENGRVEFNGELWLSPSTSSSNDTPDIVFYYGNGNEKARLWCGDDMSTTHRIQTRSYDTNGTLLESALLSLVNDIKIYRCSDSVTVPGNSLDSYNLRTITIPTGYKMIGILPLANGYADQWLVSYGFYGNNTIRAMIHSKYNGSLTNTLVYYLIFLKQDYHDRVVTNI